MADYELVPEAPKPVDQDVELEVHSDGSVTVAVPDDLIEKPTKEENHYANLVDKLDEEVLKELGRKVVTDYTADKSSRSQWESTFDLGFDLLGLKLEKLNEPFQGACSAVHPLIIESAVKFQSKISPELMPAGGPVKTQIIGEWTQEKEEQAERIRTHMNYQLTEQISEYFDETERLLFYSSIVGSGFKKLYYSALLERPCIEFVPAEDFYVPYAATDLRRADRYTHVIYRTPRQLQEDIDAGLYKEVELNNPSQFTPTGLTAKINRIIGIVPPPTSLEQYTLLEQHRYEKLPGDERALPYVVTVEEASQKVLAVRRNWREGKNNQKICYFVHYPFVRGFGFYGLGWIHLLGNLTLAATMSIRSLSDSGQFANLPGGLKAKGVRVVGGNDPIAPGEWKDVEAAGFDLQKAFFPLPYKEPSQTLYQLMDYIVRAGQKFADSTEMVVADSTNYGPVGTTLALLEASSKFYNAIHKRFHRAQREELRILAEINNIYLPNEYPYDVAGGNRNVLNSDYDGRVDVIPVSDPNIPTSAHRLTMAQLLLQLSSQAPPGMYDQREVHKSILRSAGLQNIDRVLTEQREPEPMDPLSDIAAAVQDQPIKAFEGQKHQAHIVVKEAWLQDPQNGSNPLMVKAAALIAANVREHRVLLFKEQMTGLTAKGIGEEEAAQMILRANASGVDDIEQQQIELAREELKQRREKMAVDAAAKAADIYLREEDQEIKKRGLELQGAGELAALTQKVVDSSKDRSLQMAEKLIDSATKTKLHEEAMEVEKMKVKSNAVQDKRK